MASESSSSSSSSPPARAGGSSGATTGPAEGAEGAGAAAAAERRRRPKLARGRHSAASRDAFEALDSMLGTLSAPPSPATPPKRKKKPSRGGEAPAVVPTPTPTTTMTPTTTPTRPLGGVRGSTEAQRPAPPPSAGVHRPAAAASPQAPLLRTPAASPVLPAPLARPASSSSPLETRSRDEFDDMFSSFLDGIGNRTDGVYKPQPAPPPAPAQAPAPASAAPARLACPHGMACTLQDDALHAAQFLHQHPDSPRAEAVVQPSPAPVPAPAPAPAVPVAAAAPAAVPAEVHAHLPQRAALLPERPAGAALLAHAPAYSPPGCTRAVPAVAETLPKPVPQAEPAPVREPQAPPTMTGAPVHEQPQQPPVASSQQEEEKQPPRAEALAETPRAPRTLTAEEELRRELLAMDIEMRASPSWGGDVGAPTAEKRGGEPLPKSYVPPPVVYTPPAAAASLPPHDPPPPDVQAAEKTAETAKAAGTAEADGAGGVEREEVKDGGEAKERGNAGGKEEREEEKEKEEEACVEKRHEENEEAAAAKAKGPLRRISDVPPDLASLVAGISFDESILPSLDALPPEPDHPEGRRQQPQQQQANEVSSETAGAGAAHRSPKPTARARTRAKAKGQGKGKGTEKGKGEATAAEELLGPRVLQKRASWLADPVASAALSPGEKEEVLATLEADVEARIQELLLRKEAQRRARGGAAARAAETAVGAPSAEKKKKKKKKKTMKGKEKPQGKKEKKAGAAEAGRKAAAKAPATTTAREKVAKRKKKPPPLPEAAAEGEARATSAPAAAPAATVPHERPAGKRAEVEGAIFRKLSEARDAVRELNRAIALAGETSADAAEYRERRERLVEHMQITLARLPEATRRRWEVLQAAPALLAEGPPTPAAPASAPPVPTAEVPEPARARARSLAEHSAARKGAGHKQLPQDDELLALGCGGVLRRVEEALDAGKSVDSIGFQHGNTLLHVAAERADLALARLCVARGADPNIGNRRGERPLHLSIARRADEVTKFLLEHANASPTKRDNIGRTPLDIAGLVAPLHHTELVEFLALRAKRARLTGVPLKKKKTKKKPQAAGARGGAAATPVADGGGGGDEAHVDEERVALEVFLGRGALQSQEVLADEDTTAADIVRTLAGELGLAAFAAELDLLEDVMGRSRALAPDDAVLRVGRGWPNQNPKYCRFLFRPQQGANDKVQMAFRDVLASRRVEATPSRG